MNSPAAQASPSRISIRRTVTALHTPPRGMSTPRALNTSASARSEIARPQLLQQRTQLLRTVEGGRVVGRLHRPYAGAITRPTRFGAQPRSRSPHDPPRRQSIRRLPAFAAQARAQPAGKSKAGTG